MSGFKDLSRVLGLFIATLLVATGCAEDDKSPQITSRPKTTAAATTTITVVPPDSVVTIPISEVKVKLTKVGEFDSPLAIVARYGHEALYVAERAGRVRVFSGGLVIDKPLVDISLDTTTEGERGLLGLTFSPDGSRLYLSFTDESGNSRLDEFIMGSGESDIDLGSRRTLLKVTQPFENHNGGHIVFGPDDMLYLGLGDGGSSGDPDQRAQDTSDLLGKILRIDPRAKGEAPYSIPTDNPFVDNAQHPNARGEVWVYGLRNPWRFSFDRANGDLWVGDVGQNAIEEVDWLKSGDVKGANLGWDRLEGTKPFEGKPPVNAVGPVHEYGRSVGESITGGIVYRGTKIAGLQGRYVFGDLVTAHLWALVPDGNQTLKRHDLRVKVYEGTLVSFGEDSTGELYVVSIGGLVYRLDPAG